MKTTHLILSLVLAGGFAQANAQARAAGNFRCGGVGIDQSTQMKADAAKHDIFLTFAVASTGAYLSDVDVDIRDAKGAQVAAGKCSGPILLADVPAAGTYQVTATYKGVARQQTVTVGKSGKGAGAGQTLTWAE